MRIDESAALLAALLMLSGLTGCGGGMLGPQPYVRSGTANFDEASAQATKSLLTDLDGGQGMVGKLQSYAGVDSHRVVVIDPMIDGIASQQTALSRELERRVTDKAHALRPSLDFHSLTQDNAPNGDLLLTGTISPERSGNSVTPGSFVIRLALTDLKTHKVVAQASASGRDTSLDLTPSGFHQDSPAVLTDKVTEGYVRTASTPTGQDADATYVRELPSSAAIARGTESYNRGDYPQALGHFQKSVLLDPSGEQIRASTGLYLTNVKLGHPDQAEAAFSKMVSLGLANHNLGLKFLFNSGTTDFFTDPRVSGQYPAWIRQIAHGIEHARVCVDVVGHSSHTGAADVNDRLSTQRAERVRQRLIAEVPVISSLTSARGMGFRENIIGTGTDDLRDAVDRRVEFKVRSCMAA